MPELGLSGSVGARGGKPPWATRLSIISSIHLRKSASSADRSLPSSEIPSDQLGQLGGEAAAGEDGVAACPPGGGEGGGVDVRAEGHERGPRGDQLAEGQERGGLDEVSGRQVDEDDARLPL